MNRRRFVEFFFGSAAVSIFVPRLVVAPPPLSLHEQYAKGVLENTLIENYFLPAHEFFVRETLLALQANLKLAKQVNRDYDALFLPSRIGETINVRKPQRFVIPT